MDIYKFLHQYKKLAGRYGTFSKALIMANDLGHKTFVETGTTRKEDNWAGDGQSTLVFGDYCKNFGGKITTCDIDQECIDTCKTITKKLKKHIKYVCGDSINFLKKLKGQIDFLYLDSYDFDKNDPDPARNHNLEEFKAAEDKLHDKSIVLIDDTGNHIDQGKGKITIQYMLQKGWKIIDHHYQTLLAKQNFVSKKVLFVFWHGLGDCVLATPAIKKYKLTTHNHVGWAMLRRFKQAELFKHNPYIDQILWTSDAWDDHGDYRLGINVVIKESQLMAERMGYDDLVVISHGTGQDHKIYRTAREMGVTLEDDELHTEFYYDEDELKQYEDIVKLPKKYLFYNGKAGLSDKNIPENFLSDWMSVNNVDMKVISSDTSWDCYSTPIAFAAEVMKKAKHRVLVDSALYHIAHAMDLKVDFSYFSRGKPVHDVVRPLHCDDSGQVYYG